MPQFEVDYTYKIKEYGVVTVDADNITEAEEQGIEFVKELYTDISDVEVDAVREIKS